MGIEGDGLVGWRLDVGLAFLWCVRGRGLDAAGWESGEGGWEMGLGLGKRVCAELRASKFRGELKDVCQHEYSSLRANRVLTTGIGVRIFVKMNMLVPIHRLISVLLYFTPICCKLWIYTCEYSIRMHQ